MPARVVYPKMIVLESIRAPALVQINRIREHMGWAKIGEFPKGMQRSHTSCPVAKCFKKGWNISRYSARCCDKSQENKLIKFLGIYKYGGARLPEEVTRLIDAIDMYKIMRG